MLEHVGVTNVTTEQVLAITDSIDLANFSLTREEVFSFFTELGIDYSKLSTIAINEVMAELGIAEPVIDSALVLEMLDYVGVTDVTEQTVTEGLTAAEVTADTVLDKPGIVEFLYAIGVDYEAIDPLQFQEVLTMLGVEPPSLNVQQVTDLLKQAGVSLKGIDFAAMEVALSEFDFATEILDQKTVLEFLRGVGVQVQFIDPAVFADILFNLGVDVPKLSVDDVLALMQSQSIDTTAFEADSSAIKAAVDEFNAPMLAGEGMQTIDAAGVLEFVGALGITKDQIDMPTLLSSLEELGFFVINPDTLLTDLGVDTTAMRGVMDDLGLDTDVVLEAIVDPNATLDLTTIAEGFDTSNPKAVLEKLDSIKEVVDGLGGTGTDLEKQLKAFEA
jgi:hypothetical protein